MSIFFVDMDGQNRAGEREKQKTAEVHNYDHTAGN
jgi:hypothetical protein